MATTAMKARGTKVQCELVPGSGTFVTIKNARDVSMQGAGRKFDDVTSHDADNDYEEMSPNVISPGKLTFPYAWNHNETTHQQLFTHFQSGQLLNWKVEYPDGRPTVDAFAGYIESMPSDAPVKGHLGGTVSIQISGAVTRT
jgi:hypothetical protein